MNKKKLIIVYTDGSCSNNGKKDSRGGIGIHFPNKELKDVSKKYSGENCTNQKTELYAILLALKYIDKILGLKNVSVCLKTDSEYSINCITKWVSGWIKNGWKTVNKKPVSNREFIEPIYILYTKYDIEFNHVSAHTGADDFDSIANARADTLATRATQRVINNYKASSTPTPAKSNSTSKSTFNPITRTATKSKSSLNPITDKSDIRSSETGKIKNNIHNISHNTTHNTSHNTSHNTTKNITNFNNLRKGVDFEIELIKK